MSSVAPPGAPPLLGIVANPSCTDAPPPPPRSLPDDLIPGILLRLPPDDLAGIVRASAVCKAWRRTIADPAFAGRYRALHPKAPVLGFLHNQSSLHVSRFVPTTSFRPSPAAHHRRHHAHDCRHGRALFYDYGALQSFVVWDPITGGLHQIPEVPDVLTQPAVVCAAAAGDCDHRGCGGGPFIVAFAGVENIPEEYYHDAHACFYASDTGEWSVPINIHLDHGRYRLVDRPAALVGDELYFVGKSGFLLRYRYGLLRRIGSRDILSAGVREADVLSVIKPPANAKRKGNFIAMASEDGGLGLADLYGDMLSLWRREKTGHVGRARSRWVQARVIDLKTMLPVSNPKWKPCLSGVAEDASVIFVSTEEDGVYTINLKFSQVKKVGEMGKVDLILPFVSFYTDSLLLKLANGKLPAANVGSL